MSDDNQLGLSIRFVQHFDVTSIPDWAFMIAVFDERDVPFIQKYEDALEFLRMRTH